jgi:Tfp pilus assembly protein PilO
MPKKETKASLITLLLIDIISVGAFIFLFSYTTSMIESSINIENDLKTELKKDDTRALMKNDLAQGKIFQDKLQQYMIPAGGTVDFIKTIEQLVLSSALKSDIKTVANISYDKGNAIGAELLSVNMDVIGEWKNIQLFLKMLENYPLKIEIKKLSFSKVSDYTINGKKIPQWSGSFEFTVVKIKDTK